MSAPETTSAETVAVEWIPPVAYNDHAIIDGTYVMDGLTIPFKYSDGFFEVDPHAYQTHMATTSLSLSHSGTKNAYRGDYSVCTEQLESIFEQIGFENVYVSASYLTEPTVDSVGCVIAEKSVESARGTESVIAIVLRSGAYRAEWASNFLLGESGESSGIASAADQVVNLYLEDFLSDKAELRAKLDEGKVAFWVQGYSRGGGVGNLTAKRLVDLYQPAGNDVYAYCIDAQMGGVREAERPDRDYTVIHNVVNPSDLIPYLAPSVMGFMRYGLDHYLYSGKADVENPITDESGHPVSDNKRLVTMPAKRLSLIRKQLVELFGEGPDVERNMPYVVDYKGFNLFTQEIVSLTRQTKTATFIESFLNGLAVTDRETYVSCGLEAVLGRLMVFLFSGAEVNDFADTALLKGLLSDVAAECKDTITDNTFWSEYGKMTVNFQSPVARVLTDAVVSRLRDAGVFRDLLTEYPEGGYDRAINDLEIFLYRMLYAVTDLDDLVTFALNVFSLTRNHEYIPNLAILRSYDSWYEPTADD